MAQNDGFNGDASPARRGTMGSRIQTGFTALLTLFFIGVSAWSINSIVKDDRPPGVPPAQRAPAEQAAPEEPAPAPAQKATPAKQQQRPTSSDDWIVNAPN